MLCPKIFSSIHDPTWIVPKVSHGATLHWHATQPSLDTQIITHNDEANVILKYGGGEGCQQNGGSPKGLALHQFLAMLHKVIST